MALEIEWTAEAEAQLDLIIGYLMNKWSHKEIDNFFIKLENAINSIRESPQLNKKSERKAATYEYQLTKQTTIFYCFNSKKVTILLLWQNRMNPFDL